MRIYTKTGDDGEASLYGGQRVKKNHARLDAFGTLDELNAALGLARAEAARDENLDGAWGEGLDKLLLTLQHRLFDLGAELATPAPDPKKLRLLGDAEVAELESAIDRHDDALPPLDCFVLPGGSVLASQLHAARCVCRRAERAIVDLACREGIRPTAIQYVNRLGDLLFVLARGANRQSGREDVFWERLGGRSTRSN